MYSDRDGFVLYFVWLFGAFLVFILVLLLRIKLDETFGCVDAACHVENKVTDSVERG